MSTKQQAATRADLEDTVREIWQTAQDADGSRGGMQDALDDIQTSCVNVFPDLDDETDEENDE